MDIDTVRQLPLDLPDLVAQVVAGVSGDGELVAYGHEQITWVTFIVRKAPGHYLRIVALPNQLVDASYMSHRLVRAALEAMPDAVLVRELDAIPEGYQGPY